MIRQHFAHQAEDGNWHAVYRSPTSPMILTSVGDACSRVAAMRLSQDADAEYLRANRKPASRQFGQDSEREPA